MTDYMKKYGFNKISK